MKPQTNLEQLLDAAAAEGRVLRLAQDDCAGLPRWGHRHERRVDMYRYALGVCLALTLTIPAFLLVDRHLPSESMALAGYDRAQALHTATIIIS